MNRQNPRPTPSLRLFARLGLLSLVGLGPLGCNGDDVVAETGETSGNACGLLAGDLVISEVVANVEGADAGLEWFEIYNASGDALDLQGLTLIYEKPDGSGRKVHLIERSVPVAPGGYVVVGSVLDELSAGLDHLDYGYAGDLGEFGNGGGYLAVECEGDAIDALFYVDASESASRALDGSQPPDAVANDSLDSWCDSRTEFINGFAATPRAANDVCGSATSCELDGETIEVVRPAPGDLVITEVLPNPDVTADNVGEWFEIHSLAAAPFHLNGVDIGKSVEDDALETIAASACIVIEPGEYAVVAASDDPTLNGGIPAEVIVWETGVSLTNSGGSLWLGVGDDKLDVVTWGRSGTGEAMQLDPDLFDPAQNDDPASWCDATEPYGDGDLGTPGAANLECLIPPPPGQCYEAGELRDIAPVAMGELEIVEILPNPEAVADADGEWFELRASGPGDLNGLQIGKAGGVQHTVDFGDAPAFGFDECISVDTGDRIVFAHSDDPQVNGEIPQVDVLFDMAINNSGSDLFIGYADVVWDQHAWTSSSAGAALSKDQTAAWCDAVDAYGLGDLGTPGAANPMCGGGGSGCIDPDTQLMRNFDAPMPGELTLTEIMPNPSTAEPGGEWFEFHTTGGFDLNGLQLGKDGMVSYTVSDPMCIEIPAGRYVVMARSADAAANCNLPGVDWVYQSLSLTNSNSNLQLGYGGMVLTEHSWGTTQNGAALSYDEVDMVWCNASADWGGCGDLASPSAQNPSCGGMMMGNQCLDGLMMRDPVAPGPGDLVITEFMANPDAVPDAVGEWFEIRALASFDLYELELGKVFPTVLDTVPGPDCLAMMPGETALFAISADMAANGGLPPVDVEIGFGLTNSNSGLFVSAGGVLLDAITWTSTATGSSTTLDPGSYDPMLNDMANNALPWCYSATPYGLGDEGTPGADNELCP